MHKESPSVKLELHWFLETRLWLVGKFFPWKGSRVQFGQLRGLCLNPRTTEEVAPRDGIWFGTEYLLP